jgi:hypothetical protein
MDIFTHKTNHKQSSHMQEFILNQKMFIILLLEFILNQKIETNFQEFTFSIWE